MAVVQSSPRACYHPEWPEGDAAIQKVGYSVPLTHKDRLEARYGCGSKIPNPKK